MSGDICGDNSFEIIHNVKEYLVKHTNIETQPEEMAVVNSILFRLWQCGYLNMSRNDASKVVPLPKKAIVCRYSLEVFSDKGDLVAFDYKDGCWVKLEINDDKVAYSPTEVKTWISRPAKEE